MKRLTLICGLLIIALCIGANFAQADQKTEELIAKLEAKAKTINSYRADSTMQMEMFGKKMVYTGTLAFKKPDKSRMEMNTKLGNMDMKQFIISDGKTMWTYQPHMNTVQKIDLEKIIAETGDDSRQRNGDPSDPFQSLNRDSIVYVRTDKIDGKDVHIFKGNPLSSGTENMPLIPSKLEIGLNADSGMLSRMAMFNKEGKEMMSQHYSNIRLNTNIPDSEFDFTPPEGAQVLDITESTLKMMKQIRGGEQE